MTKDLFTHQDKGWDYLSNRGGGFLFWKPRVGKTLPALCTVLNLGPVLILTKNSIMETFKNALIEDLEVDERLVGICATKYTRIKRELILADYRFVICNYEAVIPLRAMKAQQWGAIIFDESFALANMSSKTTRYIERSIKKQPVGQIRIALTGTPNSESPLQFATQFFIIDQVYMGYSNIHDYIATEWRAESIGRDKKVPVRKEHLDEIKEYVQTHASILTLEELGLGSKLLYSKRYVELNDKQLEAIQWALGRKDELNALAPVVDSMPGVGNMVYAGYENMISAGIDPRTRTVINTAKIEDVLSVYKDTPDEPMLILSWYVDLIPVTRDIFKRAGIHVEIIDSTVIKSEAEEIRKRFQDGEFHVVVAQSKVIGEGLDFSRANNTFYLSNCFSLNVREQSIMRTTNIKKKTPVQIIDICTRGTIDSEVVGKLNRKEKISSSFLAKHQLIN